MSARYAIGIHKVYQGWKIDALLSLHNNSASSNDVIVRRR
jgi:hypothetical protein